MGMTKRLVVAILGEGTSAVSVVGMLNTSFDEVMGDSGHDEGEGQLTEGVKNIYVETGVSKVKRTEV